MAKTTKDETLIRAACAGDLSLVQELLSSMKPPDVNCRDKNGLTPLMHAAISGRREVVSLLVERQADVSAADSSGCTALMRAAQYGHAEIALMLMANGSDVNAHTDSAGVGWSSLMFAAWQGREKVAELLLEHHANLNCRTENGWGPLMFAAKEGHENMVAFLIEKGVPINDKTDKGHTALGLAALNGHPGTVRRLIMAGADVNAKDDDNNTPLKLSLEKRDAALASGKGDFNKYSQIAEYLSARGAKAPMDNHRLKMGPALLLVSFLFFGLTFYLATRYSGGSTRRCDICGAPAEWSETYVYESTGKSEPPTYRCALHRDSLHPGTITIWIGFAFLLCGVSCLLSRKRH